MSGGFFRGTSADQDTRFSNKHAKLMKSQKFAPELENLVDITKVKMDVMRPWIANRVTELLGFEDEVLINFIYGLLDGKVVNGKEIQISLTGFMEKNTGKFMKELWTLLLSAEKNVSGVPQQFLDEKEEETRKKKAETDRITNEIEKRKEKEARELEQQKAVKMDGEVDNKPVRHQPKEFSTRLSTDLEETTERNGARGRIRGTPSRSNSGSFSNSRSRSDERHRSRSISRSPVNRRSVSSEGVHHSPLRRSTSPHRRGSPRRPFSPSRRRTSQYRKSSISPSCRRSRSPVRRRSRSPMRRRSRSPVRRRSRCPVRRRSRSPVRRRSRTPIRRRRSPVRYRSRSPVRSRSRSPVRRRSRSLVRRRSPSPVRHQSPSLVRRRSPPVRRRSRSPFRRVYQRSSSSPSSRSPSPSPIQRRPAIPSHKRSPTPGTRSCSPQKLSSQSPVHQTTNSRDRRSPKHQSSPAERPQSRIRTQGQQSPGHHSFPRDITARSSETKKGSTLEQQTMSPPRSSQRDPNDWNRPSRRMSSSTPSPYNSPSPPPSRIKGRADHKRANSPYESPSKEPVIQDGEPSPPQKLKVAMVVPVSPRVGEAQVSSDVKDAKHKSSGRKMMHSSISDELKVSAKGRNDVKGSERRDPETLSRMSRKAEERNSRGSVDSTNGASDEQKSEVGEKRKHNRSKRQESDDDYSSDSQPDGRKEAKRRREEKKLRKEERRRRRREERHRKKEERRAEKMKLKSIGSVSPPSDLEKNHNDYNSDGLRVARNDSHSSDHEEESETKKLEIALRKKALESLRAKKGVGQ